MRGATLASVVTKIKAECGMALTANADVDAELYYLVDNMQTLLATEFPWPFMRHRWDQAVAPQTRFVNFPTLDAEGNSYTLDKDRPFQIMVKWSNIWQDVVQGIDEDQYNTFDSDALVTSEPIQRWAYHETGVIEVWPLPTGAETLRFNGTRLPKTLLTAGVYDPALFLDLDDLLIVYMVAGERLAKLKQPDASVKLSKAQQRLAKLRADNPTDDETVIFGRHDEELDSSRIFRRVAVVGVR